LTRFDTSAPAELQRIISKALRKDPRQRYQTMRDLQIDLQTLGEAHPERTPAARRPD
jgi:serine/threonine protein kinase